MEKITQYIVHRYNHQASWLKDYTSSPIIFDSSASPLKGSIKVDNIGSDINWKLKFIIDNYSNLPDVAILIKCNLFDYIKPREFEKIKDNKTFTPILSQEHHTYMPVCYYKDGMYYEINNFWYLTAHPPKNEQAVEELSDLLGLRSLKYVPFAPGSNYLLPKANILKHPKSLYEKLRSYLDWTVYPGECQIIERGLYLLWNIPQFPHQN